MRSLEAHAPGAYAVHRGLIEAAEAKGWTFRTNQAGDHVAEKTWTDDDGHRCSHVRLDADLAALVRYIVNSKERT